ncbi:hypothetical protein P3T65_26450 [Pseudomonas nitroreducens]|uniref:hypothetical protein n=1 Tax=Pseudomonas nitroreducens TaxID=46680 RepID=UPI0023F7846D|nr:hypothetical protein [Pseudomonas nitroreducens]WEW97728.1 hypothetical protein P3T65_26450 [Pseudomonas nitroreducens]
MTAKSQQERSKAAADKRERLGEVELRHNVPRYTRDMLRRLMRWHGVTEQAEAMQLLILSAHALGQQGSAPLFAERLGDEASTPEVLRHRLRPGPLEHFRELMRWHGIETDADAAERLVRNAFGLGRDGSAALLTPPRHEISISKNVERKLQQDGRKEAAKLDKEEEP